MLCLRIAAIWELVLSKTSISLIFSGSKVGWQASYDGGGDAWGADAVTTGEDVAVAVTTGEVVAVVWTMTGVAAGVFSLWHLMAVMMMITTMITVTAAPPEPMIGTLKLSRESRKEEVGSSVEESTVTLLRAKTVSLKFSFPSFQCCSMILMRWLEKCTTCVSPDLIGMELQLMRVDWSEQARGSRSFVSEEMIHSFEGFVV